MSAGSKVKKTLQIIVIGMFLLYAVGVGLQFIGAMMAGDDVSTAMGMGEDWYGYILPAPPKTHHTANKAIIELTPTIYGTDTMPLAGIVESQGACMNALAGMKDMLNDPENSFFLCGLNCEVTGEAEITCDEVIRTSYEELTEDSAQ